MLYHEHLSNIFHLRPSSLDFAGFHLAWQIRALDPRRVTKDHASQSRGYGRWNQDASSPRLSLKTQGLNEMANAAQMTVMMSIDVAARSSQRGR